MGVICPGEACRRRRFQPSSIQATTSIFARFLNAQTRRKWNSVFNVAMNNSPTALSERTAALGRVSYMGGGCEGILG